MRIVLTREYVDARSPRSWKRAEITAANFLETPHPRITMSTRPLFAAVLTLADWCALLP